MLCDAQTIKVLSTQMGFELVSYSLPLGENGKPNAVDIPTALSVFKQTQVDFLYIGFSSFLMVNRDQLTSEAIQLGLALVTAYEAMAENPKPCLPLPATITMSAS